MLESRDNYAVIGTVPCRCGSVILQEVVEYSCLRGMESDLSRVMARKSAFTLHSCISVTDKVKNKEQSTSIATGPLYLLTEFEAI